MSEPTESTARYEELLKCAICLDMIEDEKMLPCSHMFCLQCLEGLAAHSREIKCPECRSVNPIPPGGIKSFPKNIKLRQFLDQLCPCCSKNPKTEHCPHCKQTICAICKELHVVKVREDLTGKIEQTEKVDDGKVIRELKKEKKVLKDKEKLTERAISKAAEDLIKIIRNREKKLKSDMKEAFKKDLDEIESQQKKYQDGINTLKSFGRKGDLPKLGMDKLMDIESKWKQCEQILQTSAEGVTVKPCEISHSAMLNPVGIVIKRNWKLQIGDETIGETIEQLELDTSSVHSNSPLPIREHSPAQRQPSCVIGGKGLSPGKFDNPFGAAISPVTGNLVTTDTKNDRLQIFSIQGQFISVLGSKGSGNKQFSHPIGVTVAPDGTHIVTDTKNNRIEVLDKNGHFVRAFGREGSGICEFRQPWGVTMDSNKILYITDCGNNRVQVVTSDGRYIRTFGERVLVSPTGIVIDKNGDIIVANCEKHRLQVFSPGGVQKQVIGREGNGPGDLSYPDGLALDKDGNIIVAEWGNHRVQILSKTGQSLRVFGRHGSEKGEFQEPRGVAVTSDGKIVVCDCGNNRLQVF